MWRSVLPVLSFATPLVRGAYQVHYDHDAYNSGQFGTFPSNTYHSTQETTPQLQVNTWDKDALSNHSHIFLSYESPSSSRHPDAPEASGSSPLILRTSDLSPVYANRSFQGVANVKVHHYNSKPILSFYGGPIERNAHIGNGWIYGYDDEYNQVRQIAAQDLKVTADMHEFVMTGPNTAIITAYETTAWEDDQDILDSIFQEINLDTSEVLFQWRASDHIDTKLSFHPKHTEQNLYGWDFFHITSVQKSQRGDYLVSGAHMHSIYLIDGSSGQPKWTLGGQANDFTEIPPEIKPGVNATKLTSPLLSFAWQNHATFVPGTDDKELTLFDNHARDVNGFGCTVNCSRALHIRLETHGDKRAQLVQQYLHPSGLWSSEGGSVQVLDNGNVFIGWGRNPAITEHVPNGTAVFDIQFSPWRSQATGWRGLDSYRAFKWDWHATPAHWDPAIAVARTRDGSLTAWASWNGATEVVGWALIGSAHEKDLDGAEKVLARAAAWGSDQGPGFETKLWVEHFHRADRYVRAVAVGDGGRVLGASKVWDTMTGMTREGMVEVTTVGDWKDGVVAPVSNGDGVVSKKTKTGDDREWSWASMLMETVAVLGVIYAFVKCFGR